MRTCVPAKFPRMPAPSIIPAMKADSSASASDSRPHRRPHSIMSEEAAFGREAVETLSASGHGGGTEGGIATNMCTWCVENCISHFS